MAAQQSRDSNSNRSSSLSRPSDLSKNPISRLVNDYYVRQQAQFMQSRKRRQTDFDSLTNLGTSVDSESVILSPPTASRDVSAVTAVGQLPKSVRESSHLHAVDVSRVTSNSSGVSSTATTVERLLKWSEKRERALQLIREEEAKRGDSELTFRPAINATAVDDSRGQTVAPSTSRNLFVDPSSQSVLSDTAVRDAVQPRDVPLTSVSERLLRWGDEAEKRKQELRRERDQSLADVHPFHPQTYQSTSAVLSTLNTSKNVPTTSLIEASTSTQRSYYDPTEAWDYKRGAVERPPERDDPECTFRPTITTKGSVAASKALVPRERATFSAPPKLAATADVKQKTDAQPLTAILPRPLVNELMNLRAALGASIVEPSLQCDYFDEFLDNVVDKRRVTIEFQSSSSTKLAEAPPSGQNDSIPSAVSPRPVMLSPHQFRIVESPRVPVTSPVSAPPKVTKSRTVSPDRRDGSEVSSLAFEIEPEHNAADDDEEYLFEENDSKPRVISFQHFLRRQEYAHQEKQRKIAQLQALTAPPGKPSICNKSRTLVKVKKSGPDSDGNSLAPSTRSKRRSASAGAEAFTFRPVITKIGSECPSRGVAEMHLDGQRKLDRLESAMKQRETQEMDDVTFTPDTNRERNATVQSMLNPRHFHVLDETIARQRSVMEERRLNAEKELLMREVEQCTFRPRIQRLPSYVVQMTNAAVLLRSVPNRETPQAALN